jgi:hypothetical protein
VRHCKHGVRLLAIGTWTRRPQSTILGPYLLQARGDLAGAEVLLSEALQARREMLGDRHMDTLTTVSNLVSLLKARGDLAGAEAQSVCET